MRAPTLGPKALAAGFLHDGHESVGSTNELARLAVRNGARENIWFTALEQTNGRGRRGRPWSTQRGNLAASLMVLLEAGNGRAASLGFVAGVSLIAALGEVLSAEQAGHLALKWPNDVLADGKKLSGILLEAHPIDNQNQAIVIGMGVNVVATPEGLPYATTSLREMGANSDAAELFSALSDHFADHLALWNNGEGLSAILDIWRRHAAGIGDTVKVATPGGAVEGRFEALGPQGHLILLDGDHVRHEISAGDVYFRGVGTERGAPQNQQGS